MAAFPHHHHHCRHGAGEAGVPGQGVPSPAEGGARALSVWAKPGPCFIPAWGRGAQTDALVSGLSLSTKATGLLTGRARGGGWEAFLRHFRRMGF